MTYRLLLAAVLVGGVVFWAGVPANCGKGASFEALDAKTQRELAHAARDYLDPDVEFLWRPRRDLVRALDDLRTSHQINALEDIPFLRKVIYHGRHFLSALSDKMWLRDNRIEFKKSGPYQSLKSDEWRLSYALPHDYPSEGAFDRIPRHAPYPLLLTLHDQADLGHDRGRGIDHPGAACLKRRYPREAAERLYDDWLLLAPVATRAGFLEDDGAIRHDVLTNALTGFWRRYHVDYDRIIVDGREAAAALAAAYPQVFAGLVLRGGEIEGKVVRNYANVPVFVVGSVGLAQSLERFGHPDVTVGNASALLAWLAERRRQTPRRFHVTAMHLDHHYAGWVHIAQTDDDAFEHALDVEVLDTHDDPNTVRIDARGIRRLTLYLNDTFVNLDAPVRIVLNGRAYRYENLERDFGQIFDKDPHIRKNMNFGWLYPVAIDNLPEPGPPRRGPSQPEIRVGDYSGVPDEVRLDVQQDFLLGRPDRIDDYLRPYLSQSIGVVEPPRNPSRRGTEEEEAAAYKWWTRGQEAEAEGSLVKARLYYEKVVACGNTSRLEWAEEALRRLDGETAPPPTPPEPAAPLATDPLPDPEAWFPLALRDLWWRRTDDPVRQANYQAAYERSRGTLADQYRWILGGGEGPYPQYEPPTDDPWPMLTALVLERVHRETLGAVWLPQESPVLRAPVPEAWLPRDEGTWSFRDWSAWFYEGTMRVAYEGETDETVPEAFRAEIDEQDRIAGAARTRNFWIAIAAGLIFVVVVLLIGRRIRPEAAPKA